MPLSKRDRRMEESFERQYPGRGKSVYYATLNKRISEWRAIRSPESKRLKAKRRHHKRTKRYERKRKQRRM